MRGAMGPTSLILLLTACAGPSLSAKTTDDYLQPYKFVKPLKDLESLYSQHAMAEDRSDQGADLKLVEEPSKLERKVLMTDELEVPGAEEESLPKALPLRDLKGRTRKRVLANHKTEEEAEVEEDKDQLGEEKKVDDKKAESVEPDVLQERRGNITDGPVAQPLKGKQPYYSEDEYYYYYYDDEYYDDDEPYPASNNRRKEASPSQSKYPNFPPTSKSRQPPTRPRTTQRPSRPTTTRRPTTRRTTTTRRPTRPTSRYSKPKPNPYSKYNSKPKQSSRSPEYNIQSTIQRLKAIKRQQELKRNGVPALPNPWDRLNMFGSHKSKKDPRKPSEERRPRPKPKASKPKPSPDYYEEYYYDEPYFPLKRQGYAQPRQGYSNPLALLVAPLAGIALLTAAAAVAINPVLVTVSVTGKRRKRRDLDTVIGGQGEGISPELEEKIHEMQVLEKFMSSVPENTNYQQQVLSMYLSCSGYQDVTNSCLDRVVCEYANEESEVAQEERDVISIVLYNIMANEFVSEDYKDRLRVAARSGRDSNTCLAFECAALAPQDTNTLD